MEIWTNEKNKNNKLHLFKEWKKFNIDDPSFCNKIHGNGTSY